MYSFATFLIAILITPGIEQLQVDLTSEIPVYCKIMEPNGVQLPTVPGGLAETTGGYPLLPWLPVFVQLPGGATALSVRSTSTWRTIEKDIYVPPLPEPRPLILRDTEVRTLEQSGVYGNGEFWPGEPVVLAGTGGDNGNTRAELVVRPLRWNPGTGELQMITHLEVSIDFSVSPLTSNGPGDDGFPGMLVVTHEDVLPPFLELAEWRTDQGILTRVVTIDSILVAQPGRDDAEKLRNFIRAYQSDHDIEYLLLGGDTNLIPYRTAYAMTCEAGFHPREDSLPCDLYFADLDGNWDANGNGLFGEVEDEIDLYSDLWVGRAPVENLAEAEAFVSKIIAYETCGTDSHLDDVLFLAEVLWTDPYTNSAESKDLIDEKFLPDFLKVTKLYQALGNENLENTITALNRGCNFINHDGHAFYGVLGLGDDYMSNSNVDSIDSQGRYASEMYSIGCWSAAFDFDAIAEHFLTNPQGGALSYVGNSSYGWGSPGNPCYGYSDALDQRFHYLLYFDRSYTTGRLLAETKEYFIPYSRWENVYRWHQYDVNLLGDPSLRPYRRIPQVPDILCPDSVPPGCRYFPVRVTGIPTDGLTVCLTDRKANWLVDDLDASGYHLFRLQAPPSDSLRVTVTGPGAVRTTITVPVADGPHPVISAMELEDTDGDGTPSPGDTVRITLTLLNQGNKDLTDTELHGTLQGPGILLQSDISYGNLPAGSSSPGSRPLVLAVRKSAHNGDVLSLDLQIETSEGSWNLPISLPVCTPGLYFSTYDTDDSSGGDGDGVPEPGEAVYLFVSIANSGLLDAESVTVTMEETIPGITWLSDSARADSIPVDRTADFRFSCFLDPSMPSPSFPWLHMKITSATAEYFSRDSVQLTVGETGISNDVESGTAGWTHNGTGDLWNITHSQSHSSSHSWHCGNADGYQPSMNCTLYSPELVMAPGAKLNFWTSFETAIYGTDGLYVILRNMSSYDCDTLGFIGSGGALGKGGLGIGTGWVRWSYLLEGEAGDIVRLEFSFVSDDDKETGNGFFIDDIVIEGAYTEGTGSHPPHDPNPPMGHPYPNPAMSSLFVPVHLPRSGEWVLSVHDISGRKLISIPGTAPIASTLELNVSSLPSGMYFVRLTGMTVSVEKFVVVR